MRLAELRPTQKWDDVSPQFHDRGFMVAGATKAELLADLAKAVDKAIAEGRSLEEFRGDFRSIVEKNGWHGWTGEGTTKGEAWRTRVIYRTNMATTYAAGRRAQLLAGNFAFWVYRHGGSREPRILHLGWNGLALPPDHAFWATHSPPNGWGCSCYVVGARTAAGIRRVGGDPAKTLADGWQALDPRTRAPKGIDRGWGYAPGATVSDLIIAQTERLPHLPAQIGASAFAAMPPSRSDELSRRFAEFVDRALSSYVQQDYMIIGALKPEWIKDAAARGIGVSTAEIAVTDRNVQHSFRGTPHVTAPTTRPAARAPKVDALDLDWYKALPRHVENPRAVFLDANAKEPVFFLVFDLPDGHGKLVIEVDTPVKKAGRPLNTVQTGRVVTLDDLLADLGRGILQIAGAAFR
nr:phage minor head protein [Tabrizicola sp. SY72]